MARTAKDVSPEVRRTFFETLRRRQRLLKLGLVAFGTIVLIGVLLAVAVAEFTPSSGDPSVVGITVAVVLGAAALGALVLLIYRLWHVMQLLCPSCGRRFCGPGSDEPADVSPNAPTRANVFASKCRYCGWAAAA